jgi:hypothetical protein
MRSSAAPPRTLSGCHALSVLRLGLYVLYKAFPCTDVPCKPRICMSASARWVWIPPSTKMVVASACAELRRPCEWLYKL